jgi:hypothetical protein
MNDATCPAPETAGIASEQATGEDLDAIRVPVLAEELRASVKSGAGGPVRAQKRIVREEPGSEFHDAAEEIRVSRQFVNRPGPNGEPVPFEQIVIELPLPAGMTPADLEADGAEQIIVTHESVQRIERMTGTVRREEVTVSEAIDRAG